MGAEFWGYRDLRDSIVRDLESGRSCGIVGGRKCGGTSLLRKLAEELPAAQWKNGALPITPFIDLRAVLPRAPFDFFREIYCGVTNGLPVPDWEAPRSSRHYAEFLEKIQSAAPHLEAASGKTWTAVLLFDSLLPTMFPGMDGEIFQNLRNLVTNSPVAPHFRIIAWGPPDLINLIGADKPLNNLEPKYLRILTETEARQLAAAQPGARRLSSNLLDHVINISGRHSYLLLGALRQLEGMPDPLDEHSVFAAGVKFIRDRVGTLTAWLDDLSPDACKLYDLIINGPPQGISRSELRRLSGIRRLDPALLKLQYHCLVEETGDSLDMITAPGVLFRRWFRENWSEVPATVAPTTTPAPERSDRAKSVFVVHGRNRRVRAATFSFLRAVGLQPIEWHEAVEATGDPAPNIGQILQAGMKMAKAVVVLLTPDDHACLRPEFRNQDDPVYEIELTGQPRPNVLFEAGMALAAFPKATVLVRVGAIRPFSDIAGIHLLSISGKGAFADRKEFIRRLKTAGCDVDDSGTEWHSEGDFSVAAAAGA